MIKQRRSVMLLTTALLGLSAVGFAENASAQQPIFQFDIPAEPLGQALTDFSAVSSQQIIMSEDVAKGRTTKGLHGRYTAQQALDALLAGTGLTVESSASGVLMVRAKKVQTDFDAGAAAAPVIAVETVTVTAEKMVESSLNVPMSLTALSGEQLTRTQSYRFEDYVGTVPGLTYLPNGSGNGELVIRGLTVGADLTTGVATYIDETPYTAIGPFASSVPSAPNLDTFDMQRIEVLKGPQGTLYGANALGGLLKYVTNAPDPSGFAATAESGVRSVQAGAVGFDFHGMVNLPLSDVAALRVVGYDNYYPGFTDDPSRGLTDTNGSHYAGGRASLLFKPTADLSIRINALYQDRSQGDSALEIVSGVSQAPLYGSLNHQNLISQPNDDKTQLWNITVNWDVGFAKLMSSTSYLFNQLDELADDSTGLGPVVNHFFPKPTSYGPPYGVGIQYDDNLHDFTQEVRLASQQDGALQWQLGGFYTYERSLNPESAFPVDATTRVVVFSDPLGLGGFGQTAHYREYAAFANLDYTIASNFDIAAGGRYSENRQSFHELGFGFFGSGENIRTNSSQGVFTWSGDARWHITPENMLYARIATGFVPGGPNDVVSTIHDLPASYASSTDVNYEAGLKSSLFHNRVTVEVSAFDVIWHDIQLETFIDQLGALTNGGGAKSAGVEWNFAYVPIAGLKLNFNGSYTHAYLTQPTPADIGGRVGDRLPNVPLWQSSASAEYERPLFRDYSGFVGANWRFLGSRYSTFNAAGTRPEMPSFAIFDLRAGVETENVTLALYVKNVGNKIGIYTEGALAGPTGPQAAAISTPRTIGMALTAKF